MGLPTNKIDVGNMALDFCGQSSIQNIDTPSTQTEALVARHYDNVRQNVLRKYTCWNFAINLATLTPTGDVPAFDYSDTYQLPADWVRFADLSFPTGMFPATTRTVNKPYRLSGRTLLMNNNGGSVNMYYIRDMEDVSQWDASFTKVVPLELACTIAYQVTKQMKLVEHLNSMLVAEIADAISINGQEVPPAKIENSRALDGRRLTYTNAFASPFIFVD